MVERIPRNLAATAGGWSARHRRKAILGWLTFVIVAFIVGTAVGQRYLTDVEQTNGQAKQALAIHERAFPFHSGEDVLIQSRDAHAPSRNGGYASVTRIKA